MSRVEQNPNEQNRENDPPREAVDRTPGKAEGDEKTVDEALRKQGDENRGERE